jgi:hypothetical protein
MMCVLI